MVFFFYFILKILIKFESLKLNKKKLKGDWPKYMRINPILEWTYSEIWYFIRILKLSYCSLYDNGYTSLDNTENTVQNVELFDESKKIYLPAWMLQNQSTERCSRKKL